MSPIIRVLLSSVLLILLAAAPSIEGSASGKHSQASTGCTCHSNGLNGITAAHNFPVSYVPGTTYSISINGNSGSTSVAGGFSLQVNLGSFSNAGSLVQIDSAGTSATHTTSGALSWALDWTAPAQGSGTVDVELAVLQANNNSQNTGDSWHQTTATIPESLPPNQPPVASNLMLLSPPDVATYEVIILTYTYFDDDGDPESNSQIRWSKNGSLAPAYDDLMELPWNATSVGDTWTVTVTPYDGMDYGGIL